MIELSLNNIKGFILDMDGVLWRADQPIGDLAAIFEKIERLGCRVVLATNNSTNTPQGYVDKLARFGVTVQPWQIVTSSHAVAHYLSQQYPAGSQVYMIGEEGLRSALEEAGFIIGDQDVVAVASGMDRQVDYARLSRATQLIRAGAPFIGTNPDRTFPTPTGLVPGTGAILAAIEAATSVPPVVLGKPAPEMYRVALERMQLQKENVFVVGDRLETDIQGAQELGCPTALVLSGVTSAEAAYLWQPAPDLIEPNLEKVVNRVAAGRV